MLIELTPIELARFWSKVDVGKQDQCWNWRGTANHNHAHFKVRGKRYYAYRIAYALLVGDCPIDDPKAHFCHACDNGMCCNPAHMFVGTARDNVHDAMAKGRMIFQDPVRWQEARKLIGERTPRRYSLNVEEAREIRVTYRKHGFWNLKRLADKYGVSIATIARIVNGKIWKDAA